jgi:hypothetical protein
MILVFACSVCSHAGLTWRASVHLGEGGPGVFSIGCLTALQRGTVSPLPSSPPLP